MVLGVIMVVACVHIYMRSRSEKEAAHMAPHRIHTHTPTRPDRSIAPSTYIHVPNIQKLTSAAGS